MTLSKVLGDGVSGLESEAPEARDELLRRARQYANTRRIARKSKALFERRLAALSSAQSCGESANTNANANPKQENAFCAFYNELAQAESAKKEQQAESSESAGDEGMSAPVAATSYGFRKVSAWVRQGEIEKLANVSDRELRKAISKAGSFENLKLLSQKASEQERCANPTLALMLAAKAEEALPDEGIRQMAISLYEKAASCTGEARVAMSARASYRMSLLEIWNGKCDRALPHLEWLVANEAKHEYGSRALYWQARCMEGSGNAVGVDIAKKALRERHPFSLHNIVMQGNDPEVIKAISSKPDPQVILRSAAKPEVNHNVVVAEALLAANEPAVAGEVLRRVSSKAPELEPEFRLYLAILLNRAGQYVEKFRVLAPLFKAKPEMVSRTSLELYYPQKVVADFIPSEQNGLEMDQLLMLSLIRQESAFNRVARSPAGALGLMQVMPSTARLFGRVRKAQLLDPSVNMKIGSKYFALLARRFEGDVELALAAYNAGPRKVDDWLRRYPVDNRVLFIDLIPFKETREYVASIARNYYWYSILYPVPSPEKEHRDNSGGFRVFAQGASLSLNGAGRTRSN